MKKIKNKYRLFALLQNLDNDFKDLSVNDFLNFLKEEIEKEKKKEEAEKNFVMNTYKSTFLKIREKDEIWGESLRLIKIEDIFCDEVDIDFERVYKIRGEEISFNKINVFKKKLNAEEIGDSLTYSELKKFSIITQAEYLVFLERYEKLHKEINSIFKEK